MSQNIFDLVDTWDDIGTTFTAIKMDVTDTNSAAGSLLLDLLVGGTSRFQVTKEGAVNIKGGAADNTIVFFHGILELIH